jgi:hypothetical protein
MRPRDLSAAFANFEEKSEQLSEGDKSDNQVMTGVIVYCHVACHVAHNPMSTNQRLTRVICVWGGAGAGRQDSAEIGGGAV